MAGWNTATQASAKPSHVKVGETSVIRYSNFDGMGDVTIAVKRPSGVTDTYTGPAGSGDVTVTAPEAGQYYVSVSQASTQIGHTLAAPTDFVAK